MGGLNTALTVASCALSAQEAAIETVNNNIANATTPGYSREIVDLSSAGSTDNGTGVAIGDGVELDGVTSVRDQLLSLRIQQQTSEQSAVAAQSNALAPVQTYFSGTSGTIGSDLSTFFSSLSALSANPSSTAARQTAIGNAQNLVQQFHATSSGLTSVQTGLDTQIAGDVTTINSLTSRIASLNSQVAAATAQGQDGGSYLDQRSALEQQLAGLTGIAITTTAAGDTVTTSNGSPLVEANESFALSAAKQGSGLLQISDSNGRDITASLTGGDLGGLLQVRDQAIPSFLSQIDSLANGFASAFNSAQASGYDLTGAPGSALFSIPATVSGSAASIGLISADGSALAVSSDGSANSNGNLTTLTGVQNSPLAGGLSPTGSFAALVDSVGNAVSEAATQSTAIQASLTQLTNQQSAVSGVSIDEESSNLIRYQQAYQAAAEVVSTIQSLFSTTINMVSGA